jgi:hypothetical protein
VHSRHSTSPRPSAVSPYPTTVWSR